MTHYADRRLCWMLFYAAEWLTYDAPYISPVISICSRNITTLLCLPSSSNFATVTSPINGIIALFRTSPNLHMLLANVLRLDMRYCTIGTLSDGVLLRTNIRESISYDLLSAYSHYFLSSRPYRSPFSFSRSRFDASQLSCTLLPVICPYLICCLMDILIPVSIGNSYEWRRSSCC